MKFIDFLNKTKNCFNKNEQVQVFNDCIQSLIAEEKTDKIIKDVEIVQKRSIRNMDEVILEIIIREHKPVKEWMKWNNKSI